ncbi:MAG: hypothetical protein ACJ72H_16275 [Candidatus Sulfotelmatobacter sp.]
MLAFCRPEDHVTYLADDPSWYHLAGAGEQRPKAGEPANPLLVSSIYLSYQSL